MGNIFGYCEASSLWEKTELEGHFTATVYKIINHLKIVSMFVL